MRFSMSFLRILNVLWLSENLWSLILFQGFKKIKQNLKVWQFDEIKLAKDE